MIDRFREPDIDPEWGADEPEIEDFAYFPLSELGKESPEVSALKDRIAVLEGRIKRYQARDAAVARGFERVMNIARHWRKKTQEFDDALRGEGITNLEILFGSLEEHRKLIAQNGQTLYVEDPNASLYLIGELEEMAERLRQIRVSLIE